PDSRLLFFFSSRRRHTRFSRDWSSDVCSSDLLFSDEPLLHGVKQRFILRAAIQPHTCLDSQRGGLSLGSDNLMARVQVGNRPAVAYNVSLKTPLISQNVSKKGVAGTARLTVRAVIGAHHRLHSGVDQSFEGREIGFVKILC